jgi:hypothetical protein
MLAFLLGAATVAVPLTGLLVHAGLDRIREVLDFTLVWSTAFGSGVGGGAKLIMLRQQLPSISAPLKVCALLAVSALVLARMRPAAGAVLAPLVALPGFVAESTGFVIVFGLLAPIFCWALRGRAFVRTVFVLGWLPSLGAGAIAAWTSTNGLLNAAIGLLPACLISNVVIVLWALQQAASVGSRFLRGVAILIPVVTVAGLVYCQYLGSMVFSGGQVYTEHPLTSYRFTVRAGPFRDIAASEGDFAFLTSLAGDLPKVVNPNGKILCYPHFPACYLMTSMRPASPHCWVGGVYDRHARWYAQRATPDDVIVRRKLDALEAQSMKALDEAALRQRRLAIDRDEYAIYTRAP